MTALFWKPKIINILTLSSIIIFTLIISLLLRPDMLSRYTKDFFVHNPIIHSDNAYWGSWRSNTTSSRNTQ